MIIIINNYQSEPNNGSALMHISDTEWTNLKLPAAHTQIQILSGHSNVRNVK